MVNGTGGAVSGTGGGSASPDAGPDSRVPDAEPDVPSSQPETGSGCPSGKVQCNGRCIDASGCCTDSDCAGTCMTCGSANTCVAVTGKDDPNGRCAGTCDSNGACKSKRGQGCQTAGGGCASGTFCSPDGVCCDTACTGSCEACDLADSRGTCKVLAANAPPHDGHTACTGSGVCAGHCGGSSAACVFPTGPCGAASCSTSGYQGVGACSAGSCSMPAVTTCSYVCDVASGGCTGICTPNNLQCKTGTNIPQKCSATGAWQDQTACDAGETCQSGECRCLAPKTACSATVCVDLQSDSANCGTCGRDCLGGACAAGVCQPVEVTSALSTTPKLFGLDGAKLYYHLPSTTQNNASDAYSVGKSATAAAGSTVYTCDEGYMTPFGVIGNELFLGVGMAAGAAAYTIGSTAPKHRLAEPSMTTYMPRWTSATPNYYIEYEGDTTVALTLHWYNASNAVVATHTEPSTGIAPAGGYMYYTNFFQAGSQVYWIRNVFDADSNPVASSGLFSTSSSATSTRTQLAGGSTVGTLSLIDANAVSVIMFDSSASTYYRVALPSGNGTGDPTYVSIQGSDAPTWYATEDAKGFYWVDTGGNINRCAPANCFNTKVQLATGQGTLTGLYQDANALYWSRTSPNVIMRLAK